MSKPVVKVSFSPLLYPIYKEDECIVVVVDILRATTAMCTALYHGIEYIIPVATVEEALEYKNKPNYIIAAERNGEVVGGFEIGNSPFSYMDKSMKGKKLVLTTTNGTKSIKIAGDAQKVIAGSFANFSILTKYLKSRNEKVMILCAGWKDRFNLEDTLFAGALVDELIRGGFQYDLDSDAAIASRSIFLYSNGDFDNFLKDSSHRKRLSKLNLEKDIQYCLSLDTCPVIPMLIDGKLIDIAKDLRVNAGSIA